MPITIPIFADAGNYTELVPLDGVTYTLRVKWNERLARWAMTVLDETGITTYVGDRVLVADEPLDLALTGRPWPGFFVAVDTSGRGIDPGPDDLGVRVQLAYFSGSELASYVAATEQAQAA